MECLTLRPLRVSSGTITNRATKAQFGDGYKQGSGDGINRRVGSYKVTFGGNPVIIAKLSEFLDRQGEYKRFVWNDLLKNQPQVWLAGPYDFDGQSDDYWEISTQFDQVTSYPMPSPKAPSISNSSPITSPDAPLIEGTAEAGMTIKIYVDDVLVGNTKSDIDGSWNFQVPAQIGSGPFSIKATATDVFNTTGAASEIINWSL